MRTRANPVYCGVDTTDLAEATRLIQSIAGGPDPAVGGIKLGLEFFLAHGAPGVRYAFPVPVRATGVGFFLDLKLHDIPNTVAGGMRAVIELEPTYITIHAGGREMMRAAVDEAAAQAARLGVARPRLLGVTVLTSLDRSDLEATGVPSDPVRPGAAAGRAGARQRARRRHLLAARDRRPAPGCGPEFVLMVPGIRPVGSDSQRPEAGDDAAPGDRSRRHAPGGRPADLSGGRSARRRRGDRARGRGQPAVTVEAKICGLTTPEAIEAAARAGARCVGFVTYPRSPRHVASVEMLASLGKAVPAGVGRVGMFVDPDDELLDEWLESGAHRPAAAPGRRDGRARGRHQGAHRQAGDEGDQGRRGGRRRARHRGLLPASPTG